MMTMMEEFKCLELVELIRSKDKDYLSDPSNLEKELLPELGFNDEFIQEYPNHIRKHCGKGLKSWQYPNQFSKYLVHLSKYKIESYLEIGVRHGGTFIITVEYLNKFHPIKKALAVDINECPVITEYNKSYNDKSQFWRTNSLLFKFGGFCNHCDGIDLTMIDGNHEKDVVISDFENAAKMSRMIAIHDMANDACPHVKKLWNDVKNDSSRYNYHEFTDQYSEFKKLKRNYFGMGLLESKVLPVEKI